MLEDSQEGLVPPIIDLADETNDETYYKDVQNVIDAFGTDRHTTNLKSLHIRGMVAPAEVEFAGEVRIKKQSSSPVGAVVRTEGASSAVGAHDEFVKAQAAEFNLTEIERMYFREQYSKFQEQLENERIRKERVARGEIVEEEKVSIIGKDFTTSAMLSATERKIDLGAEEYSVIASDDVNLTYASAVNLTLNPLNGGIGKGVNRVSLLERIWPRLMASGAKSKPFAGEDSLSAKAMDLYFEVEFENGTKELVSVAEAKLLRSLVEARKGIFKSVDVQELVSSETVDSIVELFDTICVFDRVNLDATAPKRTYRQLFAELAVNEGIHINLMDSSCEHTFPI